MPESIPQKIKEFVEYFSQEKGFKVKDVTTSHSFGDFCVILSSEDFWISIISDRSQEFVDLSYDQGHDWLSVGFFKKLLDPNISHANLYLYSFEESICFIKENYSAISNLFSDKNITETKRLLNKWFNR